LEGGDRVYAMAETLDEARSLLGVLEVGIKGVMMPLKDSGQLKDVKRIIEEASPLMLSIAEVTEVKEIGWATGYALTSHPSSPREKGFSWADPRPSSF